MHRKLFAFVVVLGLLLGTASPAVVATAAPPPWDPFFATPTTAASFASLGTNPRPYGIAAGDFTGDGKVDLVIGRALGQVHFAKGNGDGTFEAQTQYAWKQAALNVWAVASGDVNGDGKLDVIWGATAASTGCSISPIPTGQTCASIGGTTVTVNDGDVRAFLGDGAGGFAQNPYYVSGILHNAGTLLARPGTVDAASLTAGDIDADDDTDIIVGAIDGTNAVVKLLRNTGGVFSIETIVSVPAGTSPPTATPIYYPPVAAASNVSPWGLALGDVDADGDLDLWVGDRALYVYLYLNDGAGVYTLRTPATPPLPTRPNVLLAHDTFRAAVGYTPALGSADLNGDGKADLVMGLQSGGQTAAVAHDGEILLHTSTATNYVYGGATVLADIGLVARGVNVLEVDADGYPDIVAGEYAGTVAFLRQLPPLDTDNDGISDYLDNAPVDANAPRLDMNTDGALTASDQLDNYFDTVLGNPENPASWVRLGDPADTDDDNDGVPDISDNCPYVANADQANVDGDSYGDACDPLDNRDTDGDGVVDGPLPGDPLYAATRNSAIKWSQGTTHFVIRIDALGRFFQNEFTQILTDAATLSPADWATKCWENYEPADFTPVYQPCGTGSVLTLSGGKQIPISLVVIPKQLWTDPPVITWINDRNNYPELEIAQHATYHVNNTLLGDWKDDATKNFYSCETCGLTEAENFELMRVGYDTLLGNYTNKWVAESGATVGSPKIDWLTSAHPLISYSPPFNASDTLSRQATAQLGYKSFSASRFEEENAFLGGIFSPEGSHMEQFDQFGMFHASADLQIAPPDTTGDTYDTAAYEEYLQSKTDAGGLTTWLVEEVDWSGRPCPNDDRLGLCNGGSNREDNTVYKPRWDAWLQLLDYVKNYPGGVAMTLGEVALAKAYDNAPTVLNVDQADGDHNGVGDVVDGAAFTAHKVILSRNVAGALSATLLNGAGDPIAGQSVTFTFDADGDGTEEAYAATTGTDGVASTSVTPTRAVGVAAYSVAWNGLRITASATGNADIADATSLALDGSNPSRGQVTDQVTVGATLLDSSNQPVAGRPVVFTVGTATATGTTDGDGHATAPITLVGPAGKPGLQASFAGAGPYGPSSATAQFTVDKEDTKLTLSDAVATKGKSAPAAAVLVDADDGPLTGLTITFSVQQKVKNVITWIPVGTAVTDANGAASVLIPSKYISTQPAPIKAVFAGDDSFLASEVNAITYRK